MERPQTVRQILDIDGRAIVVKWGNANILFHHSIPVLSDYVIKIESCYHFEILYDRRGKLENHLTDGKFTV